MNNATETEKDPETSEVSQTITDSITDYFHGEAPITCTLKEASGFTGLSYPFLLAASKHQNPSLRLPGFRPGKKHYRVLVAGVPAWIERISRC